MALIASHNTIPIGAQARAHIAALKNPTLAQPAVKRAVGEHYRQTPIPTRTGALAASLRQVRGGEVRVSNQGVLVINHVPYSLYVVRRFKIPDPAPEKIAEAIGKALLRVAAEPPANPAAPAPSLPASPGLPGGAP